MIRITMRLEERPSSMPLAPLQQLPCVTGQHWGLMKGVLAEQTVGIMVEDTSLRSTMSMEERPECFHGLSGLWVSKLRFSTLSKQAKKGSGRLSALTLGYVFSQTVLTNRSSGSNVLPTPSSWFHPFHSSSRSSILSPIDPSWSSTPPFSPHSTLPLSLPPPMLNHLPMSSCPL
jgi:hypothetical protein